MESLFLLIPLSILVVLIVSAMGFWAFRSKQYDDLDDDGRVGLLNERVIDDGESPPPGRPTDSR